VGIRQVFVQISLCLQTDVVGFVGLGNMGSHMAKNLLKKKFKVIVYDVNPQSVAALKESGV
jgi:3-hydroxyisobutyrate dehydrogenase-like beta-hydroxyacid dehydrogenase